MSNLRNPFAEFAVEYGRLVQALWRELTRHSKAHGCGFGGEMDCSIYLNLRAAWLDAVRMQEALDWLAFDKPPETEEVRRALAEYLQPQAGAA